MKSEYYPQLSIPRNSNPNRFYAIPLIGILVKVIMLIPVFIVAWAISIAAAIMVFLVNPFAVVFTGRYMNSSYSIAKAMLTYNTKIFLFFSGLTDRYPGFNLEATNFKLTVPQPKIPNRLWAIPLLGFLGRAIIMIPYFVFVGVIKYAAYLGVLVNFIPVLFIGQYDEAFYEMALDYQRIAIAQSMFIFGLSDNYPSFKINWDHKNTKIALLIAGILLLLISLVNSFNNHSNTQYHYSAYPNSYNSQTY